jgi:uncharacterized protein (TIGR03000 family)
MINSKWSILGGLVSAFACSLIATPVNGQGCPCVSNFATDGMIYESSGSPSSEADSLLQEIDNPAEMINLTVIVAEKAIVSINGEPTVTMGTSRPYIVRGLKEGKNYKFVVDGLVKNESGAEYAATETVTLKAGESKQVVLHLRRRNRKLIAPPAPVLPAPVAPVAAAAK